MVNSPKAQEEKCRVGCLEGRQAGPCPRKAKTYILSTITASTIMYLYYERQHPTDAWHLWNRASRSEDRQGGQQNLRCQGRLK